MIHLQDFENKIYSQNGEDGIINKIFKVIGTTNKQYVEFGVEDGSECNSMHLKETGWNGIWIDAVNGYDKSHKVNKTKNKFHKQYIYEDNILTLFKDYGALKNMDFLSVDIDYNDFYILQKILTKYRPRVICAEFNCSLKFKDNIVVYTNNYYWDRTNYFNAGIIPYQKLCDKFKYDLVYCDKKGVNLFFIDKKFNSSKKFVDVNCPIKLWRKCSYDVKLPNNKIMDTHKNDYNNRIMLILKWQHL